LDVKLAKLLESDASEYHLVQLIGHYRPYHEQM